MSNHTAQEPNDEAEIASFWEVFSPDGIAIGAAFNTPETLLKGKILSPASGAFYVTTGSDHAAYVSNGRGFPITNTQSYFDAVSAAAIGSVTWAEDGSVDIKTGIAGFVVGGTGALGGTATHGLLFNVQTALPLPGNVGGPTSDQYAMNIGLLFNGLAALENFSKTAPAGPGKVAADAVISKMTKIAGLWGGPVILLRFEVNDEGEAVFFKNGEDGEQKQIDIEPLFDEIEQVMSEALALSNAITAETMLAGAVDAAYDASAAAAGVTGEIIGDTASAAIDGIVSGVLGDKLGEIAGTAAGDLIEDAVSALVQGVADGAIGAIDDVLSAGLVSLNTRSEERRVGKEC